MPQETASLKDFNSDTSKNQIAVPNVDTLVLTTVLLNGYLFFAGCWFLQTCHNRVSEVVSCFNLEAVAACPNFRSLLSSCETNKLTRKKLSALFVRYVQFLTTLYLQDPPASWYSLRFSVYSVLKTAWKLKFDNILFWMRVWAWFSIEHA